MQGEHTTLLPSVDIGSACTLIVHNVRYCLQTDYSVCVAKASVSFFFSNHTFVTRDHTIKDSNC